MESMLAAWVRKERKQMLFVNKSMVCQKAREMAAEAGIPTVPIAGQRGGYFAASWRWLARFTQTFNLGGFPPDETRVSNGKLMDPRAMATAFHDLFRDLTRVVARLNIPPALVFTMDETPLTSEMLPAEVIDGKEKLDHRVIQANSKKSLIALEYSAFQLMATCYVL